MPTVKVPLFTKTYTGIDESVLTDDGALQYNGWIDSKLGLNIRPGEVLAVNTALRNDGLFFWPDKNYIVSVDESEVTFRTASGETLVSVFSGYHTTFNAGVPTIFASNGSTVFMAGGGKINYVSDVGVVTELGDTDAPTGVTHVIWIDGYILAIDGSNRFYWSDLNASTDWSALSFASAEGNPDNILAMFVVQRQIYFFGTVSTEIWENNGSTPFSRIPGGLIERGLGAKYGVVQIGDSLVWLTNKRKFVKFSGVQIEEISSQYDEIIAEFELVSDCIGALVSKKGQDYCVFTFPAEGRTFAYHIQGDDWCEWASWDPVDLEWVAYDIRASVSDLRTGKCFVGKRDAQAIACISSDSREDVVSPTDTRSFKFLRRTGFIDHGTSKDKVLEELSFRAKRGAPEQDSEPVLMFRYRNDGSSNWSNIRNISLGAVGVTSHHVRLKRLGHFRSRQYELSATDNMPIVLSNAEAEITVGR